jgi:hypothetical protein
MNKVYVMLGLTVVLWGVGFAVNHDSSGKGPDREGAVDTTDSVKPPVVDPNRVHSIEISDAENRVKVSRQGDKWVLPEKSNAPAIETKAKELLDKLQGLEKAERVSKSAASARDKAYGLEPETAKRLKLFDENNKLIADVWVGKPDMSAERSLNVAGNFIRLEGNDSVFSHAKRIQHLVMPLLSMWLDGRIFPVEAKEIEDAIAKAERVTLEFDDVPFTPATPAESRAESGPAPRARIVLKGVDAAAPTEVTSEVGPKPAHGQQPQKPKTQKDWTITEPALSGIKPYEPTVSSILRTLLYCRAEDIAGSDPSLAEYGFDRPFVDVEVQLSDGAVRHLRVGKPAPPPSEPSRRGGAYRYATVDGVPRVFLLNEFVLPQFRKKPEDLKAPETPKTAPGGQQPIELPKEGTDSRK